MSDVLNFFLNPWVNGLILGILVLGVFISFRVLDMADLSVEGILPMITLLSCVLIKAGVSPWLVLLIAMAIGAVCGVVNSLLTIYLKIPPLLSGIIVMACTFGLAIMINSINQGSVTISSSDPTVFSWLQNLLKQISTNRTWLVAAAYLSYILVAAVILLVVAAVMYLFFGTELGMSIRAAGKNKAMSRANGINVNLMVTLGLAISGALIGLASALYGQHNKMGLPTDGQGMIVIGLSSLFLGETIFGMRGFKRALISAITGSLVYWYIIQILMKIDTNGYMLSVYKALLLVAVIALQLLIAWVKNKIAKKNGQIPAPIGEDIKKTLRKTTLGEEESHA